MKTLVRACGSFAKKQVLLLLALFLYYGAHAQLPTSLQYPATNVFTNNVDNVYLAPTVSGNVTSYSIAPTLPAGLSFNTNTGVITGTPTAATPATSYTVTATNTSGSTTATFSIQTFNYYYNNANSQVSFTDVGRVFKVGTNGQGPGNITLYTNVATIGGVQIDCIVTTRTLNNVSSWVAYDQSAVSGGGYADNSPNFFSPQLSFGAGGGSVTYDFQFILGNSYNNTTNKGTNVVLRDVKLNTYDIDGNGSTDNGSNQYNEFGGFSTSELSSTPVTKEVVTYNATSGLTRFRSNTGINTSSVIAPENRIRVSYKEMSGFSIVVGADGSGSAYFFLDFSVGTAFTTVTTSAPSIDLNTDVLGVNNGGSGCGATFNFTASSQVNAASETDLSAFQLSFPTDSIKNGASEKLVLGSSNIALNFLNGATIANIAVGTITYAIAATVANGISTLTFANSAGGANTFTLAQAEVLLDALQYQNTAAAPTNGTRYFTVNLRNTGFKSPDALFTTVLNCVGISGNIYHDANGLADNTVNANGPAGQFADGVMNAILVNPTNNQVAATRPIASSAYNFGNVTPGKYLIYFSNATVPALGATFVASTFPVGGYVSTGENLGAAAGDDGLIDGKLTVTAGSISVTNANFGLEIPPVTASTIRNNLPNPGGFNNYALVSSDINATDADGTVSSIRINSFPAGANYLKVGTTVYTNGGNCPPQNTCVAFPASGGVTVPFTDITTIAVDPAIEGATSVVINYTALDQAGIASNTSTATFNFVGGVGTNYFTISGNVWNDFNGDGIKGASENLMNPANATETLYAVLVQTNKTYSGANTIFASTPVSATTGFTFTDMVPANTNYEVRIVSAAATPMAGAAMTSMPQTLTNNWVGVSYSRNSSPATITTGLSTTIPAIVITSLAANVTAQNFGIEQKPFADAKSFTAPNASFTASPGVLINGTNSYSINANSVALIGSPLKTLSGSDAEDCAAASSCATGKTYVINTVNANTRIFYDFGAGSVEVTNTVNNVIANFDPAKLTVYGQTRGGTVAQPIGFTYSLRDNANVLSTSVTYSILSNVPLPVVLVSLKAEQQGSVNLIKWSTAEELNVAHFVVEVSANGKNFRPIGQVKAQGNNSNYLFTDAQPSAHKNYYRLQMIDLNGAVTYSNVVWINGGKAATKLSVAPIPAATSIRISGLASMSTISILDLSGRTVWSSNQVSNGQMIDVSSLAAGTYILRAIEGGEQQLIKLTIAR